VLAEVTRPGRGSRASEPTAQGNSVTG
jgi:hypothetical protein